MLALHDLNRQRELPVSSVDLSTTFRVSLANGTALCPLRQDEETSPLAMLSAYLGNGTIEITTRATFYGSLVSDDAQETQIQHTAAHTAHRVMPHANDQLSARELLELERLYSLRSTETVVAWLGANPTFVQTLRKGHDPLKAQFPLGRFFLEVEPTYDAIGEMPHLIVSIASAMEPEQAIGRLEAFYRSWWLEQPERSQGALVFSLE